MKILVVKSTSSGVFYHRQYAPLRVWKQQFPDDEVVIAHHTADLLHCLEEWDFDLILFSVAFIFKADEFVKIHKIIKEKGIKRVLDIDDYYDVKRKDVKSSVEKADALIVTNSRLKELYTNRGAKQVHIVENAIDVNDPQWRVFPLDAEDVIFGYMGSTKHEGDLKMMKHNFKDETLFSAVDYSNTLHINSSRGLRGYLDYAYGYDSFHVSLRPLAPTRINDCKSILGIIEAGVKKKACVVSDTLPYSVYKDELDGIVDFVPLGQNWGEFLEGYTIEEAEEKGRDLHKWVMKNFSMEKANKHRREIFSKIIGE